MQLVVDASIAVGESLRKSGRELLNHRTLQLVAAEIVRSETRHELPRRIAAMVRNGVFSEAGGAELLTSALEDFDNAVEIRESASFEPEMPEALRRMPRDPSDAPTVALALALGCGIWTADSDFCGCGVAVWSSDVLRAQLTLG